MDEKKILGHSVVHKRNGTGTIVEVDNRHIKATGEKWYRITNGTQIQYKYDRELYLYSFEKGAEPQGRSIHVSEKVLTL